MYPVLEELNVQRSMQLINSSIYVAQSFGLMLGRSRVIPITLYLQYFHWMLLL